MWFRRSSQRHFLTQADTVQHPLEARLASLQEELALSHRCQQAQAEQAERRERTLEVAVEQARQQVQAQAGELERQRAQLQGYAVQQQVWEGLQATLTEGCWDIDVAHGDLAHPDTQMRFTAQFRALLGYTQHTLADGWDAQMSITHPDDYPAVLAAFEREVVQPGGRGEYVVEYRMRHARRGWLWCRERGRALRDERGRVWRVIGAVRDISDERDAQQAHAQVQVRN